MVEHTDVRPLVAAGGAHRIGEQLAADDDRFPSGLGPFDEGVDAFAGDAALHKYGADIPLDEQVDQIVDAGQPGFGLGRQALDAADVQAIGPAEVMKGIV